MDLWTVVMDRTTGREPTHFYKREGLRVIADFGKITCFANRKSAQAAIDMTLELYPEDTKTDYFIFKIEIIE